MAGTKAVIKLSVMQRDVEQDCVDCAAEALTRFDEQRSVAQFMKRELDRKYGSTWHVIVGHAFGSFVTHEERSHLYFFIRDVGFLVWRTAAAAISPSMVGRTPGTVVPENDQEANPPPPQQPQSKAAASAAVNAAAQRGQAAAAQ
jgi:dynein light chain LC8-type